MAAYQTFNLESVGSTPIGSTLENPLNKLRKKFWKYIAQGKRKKASKLSRLIKKMEMEM